MWHLTKLGSSNMTVRVTDSLSASQERENRVRLGCDSLTSDRRDGVYRHAFWLRKCIVSVSGEDFPDDGLEVGNMWHDFQRLILKF
jgi:hypothetical protein